MKYLNLRILSVCLFFVISLCSAKAEELISIPIHDKHQPPLVLLPEQSQYGGIYIDLFREILHRAGIKPEFIPMPKKRVRILFENGETMLSCCDNPAWRTRPKEQQVQLFSKAFYNTKDVFIFPLGKKFSIKNLEVLSDKKVALIRGYGYRGQEWFGERVDLGSESDLIKFVSLGRADVGIINKDVASHWASEHGQKIEIGEVHDFASLHIRVHRNRQELLPKINQAIESITADGTVRKIVKGYLQD